tara:strand:+ start:2026 stop:2913 length:888 start_codon:yes stop_codon:yes gene_type:complete
MPQANPTGSSNAERLENVTFPQARIDINDNLEALQTLNSGNSEPSTKAAFMQWLDTSSDPAVLKVRNSANSSWIEVGSLSASQYAAKGLTAIANGGTGATTAATAAAALLPTQANNSGKNLTTDGSALSWSTPLLTNYAVLEDRNSNNVEGQALTKNSWGERRINTIYTDDSSIVSSLSSNQFTLNAGTYLIKWNFIFYRVDRAVTRLKNVTDSSVERSGMCVFSQNSDNDATAASNGIAKFTIAAQKVFAIEYFVSETSGETSHGIEEGGIIGPENAGNTEDELFGLVEIFKMG